MWHTKKFTFNTIRSHFQNVTKSTLDKAKYKTHRKVFDGNVESYLSGGGELVHSQITRWMCSFHWTEKVAVVNPDRKWKFRMKLKPNDKRKLSKLIEWNCEANWSLSHIHTLLLFFWWFRLLLVFAFDSGGSMNARVLHDINRNEIDFEFDAFACAFTIFHLITNKWANFELMYQLWWM